MNSPFLMVTGPKVTHVPSVGTTTLPYVPDANGVVSLLQMVVPPAADAGPVTPTISPTINEPAVSRPKSLRIRIPLFPRDGTQRRQPRIVPCVVGTTRPGTDRSCRRSPGWAPPPRTHHS